MVVVEVLGFKVGVTKYRPPYRAEQAAAVFTVRDGGGANLVFFPDWPNGRTTFPSLAAARVAANALNAVEGDE